MFRGYRLFLTALIGCQTLGEYEQGWCAQRQNSIQENPAKSAPIVTTANSPTRDRTREPCYPQSEIGISCDGIAAKAAVDQALDADKQASAVWWQFAVGVGTLVAAVAAAIWAGLAAHHTKRSADAAEAEQRAWLSIKSEKQLRFDPAITSNGDTFRAILVSEVENHGASVATDAFVHVRVICDSSQIPKNKEEFVDLYKSIIRKTEHSGRTIFPKDQAICTNSLNIDLSDLLNNKTEYGYIFPCVVILLQYKTPHIKDVRNTALAYQIITEGESAGYDGILVGDPLWVRHSIRLGDIMFTDIT